MTYSLSITAKAPPRKVENRQTKDNDILDDLIFDTLAELHPALLIPALIGGAFAILGALHAYVTFIQSDALRNFVTSIGG